MTNLAYARSFRDLLVYQKTRQLARDVFVVTKQFPKEESFSLTDQIRRSSRSVGAQIAEAWAKRRYEKHFISKLSDADGEQMETQHWVESALDCSYLTGSQAAQLLAQLEEIGRMLSSMIQQADKFCRPDLLCHEGHAQYFAESSLPLNTEHRLLDT